MDKPEFNIKNYPGDYVMHCDNESKAYYFAMYLHSLGETWCDGTSYAKDICWDPRHPGICYNFNKGTYCSPGYAINKGYNILEFDSFDWGLPMQIETPIIEPVTITGHWIMNPHTGVITCSICKQKLDTFYHHIPVEWLKYCFGCGTQMDTEHIVKELL